MAILESLRLVAGSRKKKGQGVSHKGQSNSETLIKEDIKEVAARQEKRKDKHLRERFQKEGSGDSLLQITHVDNAVGAIRIGLKSGEEKMNLGPSINEDMDSVVFSTIPHDLGELDRGDKSLVLSTTGACAGGGEEEAVRDRSW
ncbi:hypothetical protein K1719_043949 [Acacia pycnantha]|nr:hypothetical protein K1719_043949 [Acacia pycnantha]